MMQAHFSIIRQHRRGPHYSRRWPAGITAVALVVALSACGSSGSDKSSAAPTKGSSDLAAVSGSGKESMPPWGVPPDAQRRAELAGLPMGPMGMAEHYHPVVSISVDGESVEVPANIGVDPMTGQMSAVHTHTADGVIHIEAATEGEAFTLGQLFTQWDVKLAPDQLGALRASDSGTLKVTANGRPVSGDPALLVLEPDQQIDIAFTSAP